MLLLDYLRVPYRLHSEMVERAPDVWINRLSYPELRDCVIEDARLETALAGVEALRIATIVRLVERGETPPVPRPPLASSDPAWIAAQADLPPDILASIRRAASSTTPAA